jgi:hypothetical protein
MAKVNSCSLCGAPATEPFAVGGIAGHLCAKHSEAFGRVVTKFVRGEMLAQRRESRELEAELVPRAFRRSA